MQTAIFQFITCAVGVFQLTKLGLKARADAEKIYIWKIPITLRNLTVLKTNGCCKNRIWGFYNISSHGKLLAPNRALLLGFSSRRVVKICSFRFIGLFCLLEKYYSLIHRKYVTFLF